VRRSGVVYPRRVDVRSRVGPLQERPFRLLWLGLSTSAVGDAMTPVALTFAVLHTTGSAGDLGLVLAGYALAHAGFILVGGVWADRLERRVVMLTCDAVRAVVQTGMALLLLAGEPRVWHFLVGAVLVGAAESFFSPASTGLIPQAVTPGRLQQANALIALSRSGSWVFGPALSGVIVAGAGAGWVFLLDALTFVASAAFLGLLRVPPGPAVERQSFVSDLALGWREVRTRRWLWTSLLAFGLGNMAWSAIAVLGPVVAERELGGASAWGLIATGGGIGGIVGGVLALRWRPARPLLVSHALVVTMGLHAVAFAVPLPLLALAAWSAAVSLTIILANALWETFLQLSVPRTALSRISSYDWMVSLVFMPVGFALWGPLSEVLGVRETLLLAAGLFGASKAAVLLVPDVRRARRPTGAAAEEHEARLAAPA
jgi:MFS family permease